MKREIPASREGLRGFLCLEETEEPIGRFLWFLLLRALVGPPLARDPARREKARKLTE
ncbi:MAG: hypothetical protein GX425_03500 [Peptococcaceae bacterium]|nr:hypothetical protein [Peptococcaceae bacterium]